MSLAPIEIDSSKYSTGQIVHISQTQNNSDTKNVTKYHHNYAQKTYIKN